jgi:hypothetical protein
VPSPLRKENALSKRPWLKVMLSNMPYLLMLVLGAWLFAAGLESPVYARVAAAAYVVYGIGGTLWIMIFMCPHCALHGSWDCPCYGRIAALFVDKAPVPAFHEKFRKHIPVIVPLWFIPLIAGIAMLIHRFSLYLLVVLALFLFVGFVVVPLVSRGHSCKQCPQHDDCPWMKRRK